MNINFGPIETMDDQEMEGEFFLEGGFMVRFSYEGRSVYEAIGREWNAAVAENRCFMFSNIKGIQQVVVYQNDTDISTENCDDGGSSSLFVRTDKVVAFNFGVNVE